MEPGGEAVSAKPPPHRGPKAPRELSQRPKTPGTNPLPRQAHAAPAGRAGFKYTAQGGVGWGLCRGGSGP